MSAYLAAYLVPIFVLVPAWHAWGETSFRIMPPDGSVIAVGQRFDIRVEATGARERPAGLRAALNGRDVTAEGDQSAQSTAPRGPAFALLGQ
jgi:hypothetical protein